MKTIRHSAATITNGDDTDWRTVKKGTPVLFRRSRGADYEAGTWHGGFSADGTFV